MASDRKRLPTPSMVALGLLLAITLAVRVGVLVAMQDNLSQDPDAYRNIAENLLRFRVYGMGTSLTEPPRPTAYRPPLYPLLLAKFASDDRGVVLWRVAVIHVVLGLATVWLVWVVAGQMEGSGFRVQGSGGEGGRGREGEGESGRDRNIVFRFAAGLLVACDPLLLNQSTLVMTETLAAFLTVLCLFALNRFSSDRRPWNAGLAGGAIALAVLCRPAYLPWLLLVGVVLLVMRTSPKSKVQGPKSEAGRTGWRYWLWRGLNVAALGLTAAVVVSPWAIRNYRVFGKPIVSTTHGGYTLWLGNNESFYRYLAEDQSGLPWDMDTKPRPKPERIMIPYAIGPWRDDYDESNDDWTAYAESVLGRPRELTNDDGNYQAARKVIKSHPRRFAYACLYRLRQLWSPLPHQLTADEPLARTALRYAVAAWYVAVYLLAAVGIWTLRGKLLAPPWLWGVLLCLVFTGIHTFYWTNLRMRAPLMPFVALVAAYGLASLWQWWKCRQPQA